MKLKYSNSISIKYCKSFEKNKIPSLFDSFKLHYKGNFVTIKKLKLIFKKNNYF